MVDIKWDGEGGKEKELNDSGEMHEGKNQGRMVKPNQEGLKQIKEINQLWAGLKTKQGDRKESTYRYRNLLVFRLVKFRQKSICENNFRTD